MILNISDHAVLRYCERHFGLDLDEIRAEIKRQIQFPDDGEHLMTETKLIARVVNSNVVTIIENKPEKGRRRKAKKTKKESLKQKYEELFDDQLAID